MTKPQELGSPRGPRTVTSLPASVERRLTAYSLAAAAAGVGFLALPAHAQVIYTPASIQLNNGDMFLDLNCGPHLNFWMANRFEGFSNYGGSARELELNGSLNGSVMEDSNGPLALPAGSVVGSSRTFTNAHANEQVMASAYKFVYYYTYTGVRGNWPNTKHAFLGLKFEIQGQVHYGWAEFSVTATVKNRRQAAINATLEGYAFEATPNQSIMTGQTSGGSAGNALVPPPGTLSSLALGAQNGGSCPDHENSNSSRPHRRRMP